MNRNTLIKILSVIMLFAVIVSAVGCSDKENKTDGEVGVVNVDELEQDNGTAVYENTKVDKDTGKTEVVTQIIDVDTADKPIIGESLADKEIDKDKFVNQEQGNDYGLEEEEAKDVIENAENWKTFYVLKYVENNSDLTMVCKSVEADKGDGIYVRESLDAEYGIGAGSCTHIAIKAIYDANKYKSDEEIEAAFDKLNVKVQYALTDNKYAEIDDWNSVTTKVVEF